MNALREAAPILSPSILIVEDDESIREILSIIFESEGYRVQAAADGREALVHLHSAPASSLPDLILLDWIMPGMNGSEFTRIQALDPRLCNIPTVIVSATNPELHQNFSGYRGVFQKPFETSTLLKRTNEICRPKAGPVRLSPAIH